MAPEGGIGAQEWFGGPDPGSPGGVAQGYERLPLSSDKHPPAPRRLRRYTEGSRSSWKRGSRPLPAWGGGWLGAACPCGLVHSHSGKPGWEEPPAFTREGPSPGVPSHRLSLRLSSRLPSSFPLSFPLPPFPPLRREGGRTQGAVPHGRLAYVRASPAIHDTTTRGRPRGRPPSAWHQRAPQGRGGVTARWALAAVLGRSRSQGGARLPFHARTDSAGAAPEGPRVVSRGCRAARPLGVQSSPERHFAGTPQTGGFAFSSSRAPPFPPLPISLPTSAGPGAMVARAPWPGKNVKRLELGLFFSPLGKELQPKSFF